MIHGPGVVWSANNEHDNASDVDDDDEDDDDDFVKSPLIPQKGDFGKWSTIPHYPPLASSTTIVQITMMVIITSVDFLLTTMTLIVMIYS